VAAPTDDEAVAEWVASGDDADERSTFTAGEPLRRVVGAYDALERAGQLFDDEVCAAHETAASWTVISAALGTSRQAAPQRSGTRRTAEPESAHLVGDGRRRQLGHCPPGDAAAPHASGGRSASAPSAASPSRLG